MATWGDLNTVPGRRNSGGIYQRMVQPQVRQQVRPVQQQQQTQPKGDNYYTHDLWEIIQNETRLPKWYQMQGLSNEPSGRYSLDENSINKYGLSTEWREAEQSAPYGEGSTIDTYRAGNYLTPDSVAKYGQIADDHNTKMGPRPDSKYFGQDWRSITEHDKYKVLNPKAVMWDDNLGWITHKKNYNPDGDKSWYQRNAGSIIPAAMGMLLGGPAGMAIGLGTSAVNAAVGKTSWQQLLPTLLTAGLSFGGMMPSGFMGNLLRSGIRFGSGQLLNRGRG